MPEFILNAALWHNSPDFILTKLRAGVRADVPTIFPASVGRVDVEFFTKPRPRRAPATGRSNV
jgi:hypothetical protein